VRILGWSPRESPELVLPRVGFVAQEHPLYRGFTLREMLTMGRKLNPRWDDDLAGRRLAALGLAPAQRIGRLSGGQQAQVALTMALAKRPELLVLDEPVAALDPLARREFLQGLMEAVAEDGLTVLLSSHIVAELERVSDHLVILASGGVQLAGAIEEILRSHRLLVGPRTGATAMARGHSVIRESHTERQTTLLVRTNGAPVDTAWRVDEPSLEEIVLAYLGQQAGRAAPERDALELAS
jgi:ABC-2 type transport system ATP-binding protein